MTLFSDPSKQRVNGIFTAVVTCGGNSLFGLQGQQAPNELFDGSFLGVF